MQQADFEMLVKAGAITRVELDTMGIGEWMVFVSFPSETAVGGVDYASIKTARGGVRLWKNLSTVHEWIRARGWKGTIRIMDIERVEQER